MNGGFMNETFAIQHSSIEVLLIMNKGFVRYPEIGKQYNHYKGGVYEVISMATHSETQEVLVVYKSVLFGSVYARPLAMWFDEVTTESGEKKERFVLR